MGRRLTFFASATATLATILVAAVLLVGCQEQRPGRDPRTASSPSKSASAHVSGTPSAREAIPAVDFRSTRRWQNGFVTIVRITNHTEEPLRWTLSFRLPAKVHLDQVWGAAIHQAGGGRMDARGEDYNKRIKPGQRVEFGFRATGTNQASVAECSLNGKPCR
ncbi:cellulose binding domain-containing protein [Actinopolymorpha alba]|uniref:cellulose binding domain-containing protein n=1 Tax=Actinopolymorpha alba TaxID=533267 RepID=UPI00035D2169|nr:cellulose binding domain-containing protein [Actinopolymorpha alba]